MALCRESFYCMYFSQQESGQSTDWEHLIGLTAGEEGVGVLTRETKTCEKYESLGF